MGMMAGWAYTHDPEAATVDAVEVTGNGCSYDRAICDQTYRLFKGLARLAFAVCNNPAEKLTAALRGAANAVIDEINDSFGLALPHFPCSASEVCSAFLGLCTWKKSICGHIIKRDPDCIVYL